MFTQIAAKKTVDWLMQGGQVVDDDRRVYEFGLDKLFSSLVNFFFAVILGLVFGVFWQTVMFYIVYIMLRVYAGGYHAKKPLVCFFASIGILFPCVVAIRFYQIWRTPLVFWSLLLVSVVALAIVAPVEHKNKRLDVLEKTIYRRRLLRNLAIVTIGAITLAAFSQVDYAMAMLCGIMLSASVAIVGKMRSAIG